MMANMSPEELAFYQQKAAEEQQQQMMAYQQNENGQIFYPQNNMYMQNQGGNSQNMNGMLREYVNEINKKETRKRKKTK